MLKYRKWQKRMEHMGSMDQFLYFAEKIRRRRGGQNEKKEERIKSKIFSLDSLLSYGSPGDAVSDH